jgi:hypothetical protein
MSCLSPATKASSFSRGAPSAVHTTCPAIAVSSECITSVATLIEMHEGIEVTKAVGLFDNQLEDAGNHVGLDRDILEVDGRNVHGVRRVLAS